MASEDLVSEESTSEEEYSRTEPNILRFVRREVRGSFRLDHKLLDKFFPVESVPNPNYLRVNAKLFNKSRNRWKRVPANPKPTSRIHAPLTNLMNDILSYYGVDGNRRKYLATHHHRRVERSKNDIRPGIWLSGVGKEFANTSAKLPGASLYTCISAFEVVLDSDDMRAARNRLAVHMHRIFLKQDGRRFAFGLIITPNVFILHMFDHSGVVFSEPCNYHLQPERFCAVITGLAGDCAQIGFDYTIFLENFGTLTKFRTFGTTGDETVEETQYFARALLFHFPSFLGRGTLCWLATRLDDLESKFVIKDAWVAPSDPPGRESEASLMRHAQNCGITTGIAQVVHFEQVRRSDDPSDLDTVLRNRKCEDTSPEVLKLDRIHTRLIMSSFGRPLDEFVNRKELLLAFYDAVLAHRKLHDIAGILHRDITFRNILINPDGVEGDRGILIDFDHSIRINDTSPYSTKAGIGTLRFKSRGVLEERLPHTYLDDLESFYYVLCWILGSFKRVGVIKQLLPPDLRFWDQPSAAAHGLKGGYLLLEFGRDLDISPYFGTSLPALASRLHLFFRTRILEPPADPSPGKDYDEFISHIRQCIVDLEKEEADQDESIPLPEEGMPNVDSKSKHEGPENEDEDESEVDEVRLYRSRLSDRPAPLPLSGKRSFTFGRPRRSTANYGH